MFAMEVTSVQKFRDSRRYFEFECLKVNPIYETLFKHACRCCCQPGRVRKGKGSYTKYAYGTDQFLTIYKGEFVRSLLLKVLQLTGFRVSQEYEGPVRLPFSSSGL
jgi:hypothetical protein